MRPLLISEMSRKKALALYAFLTPRTNCEIAEIDNLNGNEAPIYPIILEMEINKPARKYRSMVLAKIIEQTSPIEKLQAETKMSLAARIDDLIASGNGKSDFAAAVRKSPSEIANWLSGTQNFTVDDLAEIASALNVSIADLFAPKQTPIIAPKQFQSAVDN